MKELPKYFKEEGGLHYYSTGSQGIYSVLTIDGAKVTYKMTEGIQSYDEFKEFPNENIAFNRCLKIARKMRSYNREGKLISLREVRELLVISKN